MHVEKNAYCYFTPVFADYAKHLAGLEDKYKFDGSTPSSPPASQLDSKQVGTQAIASGTKAISWF